MNAEFSAAKCVRSVSRQRGLYLRETIRYKDKNYLYKKYFTVLMKTVLLYEVNIHNYLLHLQRLLS